VEKNMKINPHGVGFSTAVWVGAVCAAAALAVFAPNSSRVMGELPVGVTQAHLPGATAAPSGQAPQRTLALITFNRNQREQADSWITGLGLDADDSIRWMRMPVLNTPDTAAERSAAESRLQERYAADHQRLKLVPVFTDRAGFVRSAALGSADNFHAVVVDHNGQILARVEGRFDAEKARKLRETLQSREL
jgi:hypothetical protein